MSRRVKLLLVLVVTIFLLLILISLYFLSALREINIKGNTYYSEKQIKSILTENKTYRNAIFLYWKLKNGGRIVAPFINEVDVDLVGFNRLDIRIYEKDVVGILPYMGEYVCFDKDGIMVGSLTEKRKDVPIVEGISYKKAVFNEMLDTDQPELFDMILNLTQLIKKYEVPVEKIAFKENMNVVLESGNIQINLGKRTHFDEQISNLPIILGKMKGMKGVLKMEEYSSGNRRVIFESSK